MDALLVYFTHIQHLLDCLSYMLCCMRATKLVHIPAHCNSKWSQCKVLEMMKKENPDPLPQR